MSSDGFIHKYNGLYRFLVNCKTVSLYELLRLKGYFLFANTVVVKFMCILYYKQKYVTSPARINHVSAKYTKLYFVNIFSSESSILFL